jgi:hypothetical protein
MHRKKVWSHELSVFGGLSIVCLVNIICMYSTLAIIVILALIISVFTEIESYAKFRFLCLSFVCYHFNFTAKSPSTLPFTVQTVESFKGPITNTVERLRDVSEGLFP